MTIREYKDKPEIASLLSRKKAELHMEITNTA